MRLMVCIGTPSLCLKKVIIAAAHIPQTSTDGNADLAAMDTLSPGDFRLLDTGNVVGVNTAGLCRSGMSQSHRQSCNQVQAGGHFFSFQQNIFRRSAVFQCVIFQPAVLTKGQDVQHPTITAEQLTDAMLDSVSGMEGATPEALEQLRSGLLGILQSAAEQENAHEADE